MVSVERQYGKLHPHVGALSKDKATSPSPSIVVTHTTCVNNVDKCEPIKIREKSVYV